MRLVLAAVLGLILATPAGAAEVVPGEVVVGFAAGADRGAARDAVDARVAERLADPSMQVLRVPAGSRAAARRLEARRGIRFAEPNYVARVAAEPDDTFYELGDQWALARIDAPGAWDVETGSAAVRVAVIDTGIDLTHIDLAANVWTNPGEVAGNASDDDANGYVDDVRGWDFVGDDPVAADGPDGHGTQVAGVLGGRGNNDYGVAGVAWTTSLIPLRACDLQGACTTARIASAITLARSYGARVVNLSVAGAPNSSAVNAAITDSPDTLFVTAAGNSGADNDATPTYPCSVPAENVVCVGSSNADDSRAPTSNYGDASVDLAAPGGTNGAFGVRTTYPGNLFIRSQGTSFAAPHVAGAAALLLSRAPDASVGLLRRVLLESVDPVPAFADLVASGGRLNAFRALTLLDATPPTVTLAGGPTGRVRETGATFSFTADRRATFECRLDAGAFAPCASPLELRNLGEGAHELQVRATSTAGAAGPPVARSWTVDRTGPTTAFVSPPPATVETGEVSFAFAAEPGATFACRLDDAPFAPCVSPIAQTLAPGAHVFAVRATDDLGNPGPVAERAVTFAPQPEPTPTITVDPDFVAPPPRSPRRLARATAARFAGLRGRDAARLRPFTLRYRARTGGLVSIEVRLGRKRIAGAEAEILRPGELGRLRVALTRRGARQLRRTRRSRLLVSATATPYLGDPVTVTYRVRLAPR